MIELWKKCGFTERIMIVWFLVIIINQIFGISPSTSLSPEYLEYLEYPE